MILTLFLIAVSFFLLHKRSDVKKVVSEVYSGEALFAGILFMKGDVAAKIPLYRGLQELNVQRSAASQDVAAEVQNMIAAIKREDGHFFSHFKTVMTSGDVSAIDQELLKAIRLVREKRAITQIDQYDLLSGNDIDLVPPPPIREVIFSARPAALENTLQREILVSQIATFFKG